MCGSGVSCIFLSCGCIFPQNLFCHFQEFGYDKNCIANIRSVMSFLLKSNLHHDSAHLLKHKFEWQVQWLGEGQRMWQGRVVTVIVWDARLPSPLPGALPSSWISTCASFALGLCQSKTRTHSSPVPTSISDSHAQENCFWVRSQPRGLAEQPSQELQEGITLPSMG